MMSNISPAVHGPLWLHRTGWALSILVILFLTMDAGLKIAGMAVVGETTGPLGWTTDVGYWQGMGWLLLICTALYAWPRTNLLGAILLTGYLGGAVATHTRVDSPLFSHILFGVYLGVLLWGGLWLRMPMLRALLPLRAGGKP